MEPYISDTDDYEGRNVWEEERCEPLGAAMDPLSDEGGCEDYEIEDSCEIQRLRALQEEQEILSSSLFSLTSHLAQVQFRLRQIVEAPTDDKEKMLMSLEEFIFRGVPDLGTILGSGVNSTYPEHSISCQECYLLDEKLKDQRVKQMTFVEHLKKQLKELEEFSKEDKTSNLSNRDRIQYKYNIISDLKQNVSHSLKEGWQQPLTKEELLHQSTCNKGGNKISTEEIISQLQSQVDDMEKFISSLKNETPKKPDEKKSKGRNLASKPETTESKKCKINSTSAKNDELRAETVNLMKKIVSLLQMFAASQFGCSPHVFHQNDLKRMNIINHWGDLRARLEMSVEAVLNLVKQMVSRPSSSMDNYDSDSEDSSITLPNVPLTTAVRKHLALNIRDLMEHGLHQMGGDINSIVPFIGCFPMRRNSESKHMHAWDLILKFYQINNGDSYNSTPARKLSESFNLDIVGGTAISNKQSMLSAIGSIVTSHKPYKRSNDSHFKAFICAGLNANKLVPWLNLLFKNKTLVQLCYSSTSYVKNTGFQDSLQSLDRLTPYKFDLPIDLAVRQFQNIKDVFM